VIAFASATGTQPINHEEKLIVEKKWFPRSDGIRFTVYNIRKVFYIRSLEKKTDKKIVNRRGIWDGVSKLD